MKFLFDLFPVILFFVVFKVGQGHSESLSDFLNPFLGGGIAPEQAPILAATAVAVIASVVQVALVYARGKKPEAMLWISLAVILVFGSLTLWLHNEVFIKCKPTILYWIFAVILSVGAATGRNFLKKLLGKQIELEEHVWRGMQTMWTWFFYVVGALNLMVAYWCDTDTWVNFKLFGLTALTLLFTLVIGFWIAKNTKSEQNADHT